MMRSLNETVIQTVCLVFITRYVCPIESYTLVNVYVLILKYLPFSFNLYHIYHVV